ncbi:hypothetical protein DM02DRAFT_701856 [Periconia macrospinosa]|uniref:Uncharacterized protein n=1 Tax=Periconia macrospinosa TaxID=97972 RepID=A0A2V1DYH2_9PLEO|nr:hypothetical protein DM02DRAFT_701856 [Periconia macrospinosa]
MAITAAVILSSFALARAGYTTINPAGTHAPVTVTSQYQPVPTYISSASSHSTYMYISTIIADADNKNATVTNTDQPITIHHQKYTITHTRPQTNSASMGMPHPTGSGHLPYTKNTTTAPHSHTWTELYEKIDEAPYRDLGPSALPAYTGSGLCTKKCHGNDGIIYQPVHVSEYNNGRWSQYNTTHTYGVPTPSATTYQQPGTYTIPKYDMTIRQTTTVAAEATYTAHASETVTYGGSLTEVHKPCTITASYGAYSTMTETGQKTTKTIIKTTTIFAKKPGTYTIAKPTTTWYPSEEVCTYPTISVYHPGVYHHTRETVKITKTSQAYTCQYHQSSSSSPIPYPTNSQSLLSPSASSHPTPTTPCPSSSSQTPHTIPSPTTPYNPDPSSDPEDPVESYGTPSAGYVKRGGVLERRKGAAGKKGVFKKVVLV